MNLNRNAALGASSLAASLLIAATRPSSRPRELISREQIAALGSEGKLEGSITLPSGTSTPFEFELTAKGNGAAWFSNVLVRLYDAHDDGFVFDPPLLESRCFRTGTEEGIEFSGTLVALHEQCSQVLTRERVRTRLVWHHDAHTFEVRGDREIVMDER